MPPSLLCKTRLICSQQIARDEYATALLVQINHEESSRAAAIQFYINVRKDIYQKS